MIDNAIEFPGLSYSLDVQACNNFRHKLETFNIML